MTQPLLILSVDLYGWRAHSHEQLKSRRDHLIQMCLFDGELRAEDLPFTWLVLSPVEENVEDPNEVVDMRMALMTVPPGFEWSDWLEEGVAVGPDGKIFEKHREDIPQPGVVPRKSAKESPRTENTTESQPPVAETDVPLMPALVPFATFYLTRALTPVEFDVITPVLAEAFVRLSLVTPDEYGRMVVFTASLSPSHGLLHFYLVHESGDEVRALPAPKVPSGKAPEEAPPPGPRRFDPSKFKDLLRG